MMKLCVNQSSDDQQQQQQQRYSINSPTLFEYDESSYGNCPVSYPTDIPVTSMRSNPPQHVIQQQTSGMTTAQQINNNNSYNQTHSPSSIESGTNGGTFTPSPSRAFDYPTSPSTKPSIPANTDYPGEFDFRIDFGELTDYAPKSAQYTYSKSLNKLFVKMNVTCPIRFKCATRLPPSGCSIRAIPVFKRPEHVTDVVTRCPNHKIPDEVHYIPNGHLIRAESTNECHVNYHVATDGRESVTVLYERPQVGAEYSTVLYKFMCLSSCVGGINRRPLLTCFTLEKGGQVLGRRVVEVRICSCPGRDRSQEERRKNTNKNDHGLAIGSSSSSRSNFRYINGKIQNCLDHATPSGGKKRRYLQTANSLPESDTGDFILHVRGREKFEYLRKMKEALDLMDLISPSQIEAYRSKDDDDHANLFRQFKITGGSSSPETREEMTRIQDSQSAIKTTYSISEPPLQMTSQTSNIHHHTSSIFQSSPPLTVTPTGVSPNPPTVTGSYGGNYWGVGGFTDPLGCDVPDVTPHQKETTSWLESLQEIHPTTSSNQQQRGGKQMDGSHVGVTIVHNISPQQSTSDSDRSSPASFTTSNVGQFVSNNTTRVRMSQHQKVTDELFSYSPRTTTSSTSLRHHDHNNVTIKREAGDVMMTQQLI